MHTSTNKCWCKHDAHTGSSKQSSGQPRSSTQTCWPCRPSRGPRVSGLTIPTHSSYSRARTVRLHASVCRRSVLKRHVRTSCQHLCVCKHGTKRSGWRAMSQNATGTRPRSSSPIGGSTMPTRICSPRHERSHNSTTTLEWYIVSGWTSTINSSFQLPRIGTENHMHV